jgi:hypothetical protein
VTEIRNEDTVLDSLQEIEWRFTNATYNMRAVLASEDDRFFCDATGDYSLGDLGVQLDETDPNTGSHECVAGYNPFGFFDLDQTSLRDTILLTQDLTVDSVRTLKVIKLTLD